MKIKNNDPNHNYMDVVYNSLSTIFSFRPTLNTKSSLYYNTPLINAISANQGLRYTRGVHCTKHVRVYVSAQKGY